MMFQYKLTRSIDHGVNQLKVYQEAIKLVSPEPNVIERLRQESLLQSALFSARIEGNPLTHLEQLPADQRHLLEVQQLARAYRYIYQHHRSKPSLTTLKKLHQMCMNNLDPHPGHFRAEQTAIFNQAGVAVYLTPPASEVSTRLKLMLTTVYGDTGPAPAKAALAHVWFEKIHPFVDGNGRVGRLLSAYLLHHFDFGFEGLVTVEKAIEATRGQYYDLLSPSRHDITDFVEYFIHCLLQASSDLLERLKRTPSSDPTIMLLPRQAEIMAIIKDHPDVSFDFIRRRFMSVPSSTIHYDFKQLMKKGLIIKLGSTRGVRYRSKQ